MTNPIPQYMGATSFLIQPGNDVQGKLHKHLAVKGLLQHILCSIFNFANDLLMVYSKTRI